MDKLTTKKQVKWLYPILIIIILLLLALVGYQGYSFYQQSIQPNIKSNKDICNQFNLKDTSFSNLNNTLASKSPLELTKEEMGNFDLFKIITTTQSIYQSSYESGKLPYNSWLNMFLGAVWIGDGGPYPEQDYLNARMPSIGYFNLSYDETKNITAKKFHQIGLCNYKQILEKSDSKIKDRLIQNGLAVEKVNTRITESEKNDENKNFEDLSTLGSFLTLDKPDPGALAGSNPDSIYSKYYITLFNELKPLLEDFSKFKDAENKEEFLKNLNLKKFQADNSLLTNEVARLKLGYENQVVKLFNIEKDLFVTFGQLNQIKFENNKDEVYLLARDLNENKIKWILPKYYVKDALQSPDKKTIYALAFNSFDTQNSPNDLGEILEIDGLTGTIKQKYNAAGQLIVGIEYIDEGNIYVGLKTDSNNSRRILNLKGGKQSINIEGTNQIVKNLGFSPDLKYFTYIKETNNEFSYPKKDYKINIVDVNTNKNLFSKEFTHYGDLSDFVMAFDSKFLNLFYVKPESSKLADVNGYASFTDLLKIDYKNNFTITETNLNTRASLANFNLQNNRGIMDNSKNYYITLVDNRKISINKKINDDNYEQKALLVLPQPLQGFDRGYAFNEDESFVYFASRYGEFHKFNYKKF